MGPRLRRQSQERLSCHEARHSRDDRAGRRLDHQYLLDRLDPSRRHILCHLRHQQGRDEPDDAHHGGRVRRETCPGQRDPSGADEDPDGRTFRRTCAELCQGRRRGDVARPRRAGADGAHGRRMGCGQRRAVSCLRRIEIRYRHRTRGRWRDHLQVGRLVLRDCAIARMPPAKECHTPDRLIGRLSSLMRLRLTVSLRVAFAAAVLGTVLPGLAHAAGMETDTAPLVDPSRCESAITANDDDRILAECGALIDNEKTAKADLIKALIVRAGVFTRKDQIERAIGDYDSVLQLDPTLADIYNTRGELGWKKGDRPRALADFAAAIRLNPDHAAAKGNYKSLAQELERLGALMAVAGKPSFNCATTSRPAEKAICANPELANLDRQIYAVHVRVLREAQSPREKQALQREQDEFTARRNADFGKPGYDMQKVMNERLQRLLGADGY